LFVKNKSVFGDKQHIDRFAYVRWVLRFQQQIA